MSMAEKTDEYFERLDAALSARSATQPPAPAATPDGPKDVSLVAEAFSALLAIEDGAPGARQVRLVTGDGEPRITEAFLEEVTRRVIERLPSAMVREVVVQVVSEVAERLVREEIARIRNSHA